METRTNWEKHVYIKTKLVRVHRKNRSKQTDKEGESRKYILKEKGQAKEGLVKTNRRDSKG